MDNHELVEIVRADGGAFWRCSCGQRGHRIGYGEADYRSRFTAVRDARADHRDHANPPAERALTPRRAPTPPDPAWPFPSVSYDYAAFGVGTNSRVAELDTDELGRLLAFYKTQGTERP